MKLYLETKKKNYSELKLESMRESTSEQDALSKCSSAYKRLQDTINRLDLTQVSIKDVVQRLFEIVGGKVRIKAASNRYVSYDGRVGDYTIGGSSSLEYLKGDLNRLAEDLTMAVYRTNGGTKINHTPALIKSLIDIKNESLKEDLNRENDIYRLTFNKSEDRIAEKLLTLTNVDTFWDEVRKLTKTITSDKALRSWERLADLRHNYLLTGNYRYDGSLKEDKVLEEDLIDDMEGKVIKRYSDVYDDKVKQRGWWYFTTHGVQPGSIPSDLHVLEIRDGKNDKGTMGTFVRLDGILNTSELKKFDMKEMRPLNESLKEALTGDGSVDKLMDDGWQPLKNTIKSDDDRTFILLRKRVDGKGKWKAVDAYSGEVLDITYQQALGEEPIGKVSGVKQLSRDLGKKLLTNEALRRLNPKEAKIYLQELSDCEDISRDLDYAREKWDKLETGIDFDTALEKWNAISKLAEKGNYTKPVYNKLAWDNMVEMFTNSYVEETPSEEIFDAEDDFMEESLDKLMENYSKQSLKFFSEVNKQFKDMLNK